MSYAVEHLNKMIRDFEAIGYTTVYKVMSAVNLQFFSCQKP